MLSPSSEKVSAVLRHIYQTLPAATALGVALAGALSFSAPLRAETALPNVGQMTMNASEFVAGVKDELAGTARMAAGQAPATAHDMGVEWQRIHELSPGEVRTLSKIVFHTNSELRQVHAHLRDQLQKGGELFQDADHLASLAVITGAMGGDPDPFTMTSHQGIMLQEDLMERIGAEKPGLLGVITEGIYSAHNLSEMTAAGLIAKFDPTEGVTISEEIDTSAHEIWYGAPDMDRVGVRELSRQLAELHEPLADHREALASSLSAAGLPANEAEQMADTAIVTGAIVGGGDGMGLDLERAVNVRNAFLKKAELSYGKGEVTQLIIEGCETARQIGREAEGPGFSPI